MAKLDTRKKQALMEKIRQSLSGRQFVSDITIVPEEQLYYPGSRDDSGWKELDRLLIQDIDVYVLVSYDELPRRNDFSASTGYLTITGAYVVPGASPDTATVLDLAMVEPVTRSLVLRASGASSSHGLSTLVDTRTITRNISASGFDAAAAQLLENLGAALTALGAVFEQRIRSGNTP
jgi:rhombotail lipoprotein